jgi:hypothetical protein
VATPSPTPVACSLGEVRFGPVEDGYLVVEVSPVMTITARGGGPLDKPNELLRHPRAEVRAGAEVPHEYVYEQLSVLLEEKFALPGYGTEYESADGIVREVGGPGRFVVFEALRTVDVPFAYECGGVTSRGSVSTWRNGGHSGVLGCDDLNDDADPGVQAMFREAAKLRC